MAATTQFVARAKRSSLPLRCLERWHLSSLDAPTVAMTWTWAVARACNVGLPWASLPAMGLAVWVLYVADRLLDARPLGVGVLTGPAKQAQAGELALRELEARHFFHYRHRRRFVAGAGLAAGALAALMPFLAVAAVRLYAIEAAMLCGWFFLLHASNPQCVGNAHRLPKEIAVGLFFAAATFIPTVAREPGLRTALLPVAALLACVCSLNCLFIYLWEHEPERPGWGSDSGTSACHATTRLALRHLPAIARGAVAMGVGLAVLERLAAAGLLWTLPAECAASAGLLLLLHGARRSVEPTALRALADAALLTPALFLPLLVR